LVYPPPPPPSSSMDLLKFIVLCFKRTKDWYIYKIL
jgi:hypothetical protein